MRTANFCSTIHISMLTHKYMATYIKPNLTNHFICWLSPTWYSCKILRNRTLEVVYRSFFKSHKQNSNIPEKKNWHFYGLYFPYWQRTKLIQDL